MPPKRKTKATQNVSDNDDVFGETPRKKSRNSNSLADEYAEDHGRAGSKGFMNWAEWQKTFGSKQKNDIQEYMSTIKKKIDAGREDVEICLEQSKNGLSSAGRNHAAMIKEAYEGPKSAAGTKPEQTSTTQSLKAIKKRQDHPLFAAGNHIIATCRNITATHEEMNVKTQGNNIDLPRDMWIEDDAKIQELLLFGRQYGEKIAEYIILPNADKSILTPDRETLDDMGELGKMAIDMYKKSSEGLKSTTWGETAMGQATVFSIALSELSIS